MYECLALMTKEPLIFVLRKRIDRVLGTVARHIIAGVLVCHRNLLLLISFWLYKICENILCELKKKIWNHGSNNSL